jgi:hypothetical protein
MVLQKHLWNFPSWRSSLYSFNNSNVGPILRCEFIITIKLGRFFFEIFSRFILQFFSQL